MFANERRIQITEMLNRRSSVTVTELTDTFQVSLETIRRDLEYLEKQGALKRVHGGAITVHKMQSYTSLSSRVSEHREEKRKLALASLPPISGKGTELPWIPVPPPLSWLPCSVSGIPGSPSLPIPWKYSRSCRKKRNSRPFSPEASICPGKKPFTAILHWI